MASKNAVRIKVGRDAGSGQFRSVPFARTHKKTAVVETIVRQTKKTR